MQTSVLLSIKPEFADRIFDGTKGFEYRRAIFKLPVSKVVVYSSSPEKLVIGEFVVEEVIYDELEALWRNTEHASGITEEHFYSYFANKAKGYAIKIGTALRYDEPKLLEQVYSATPPQSFAYLEPPLKVEPTLAEPG